MGTSANGPPTRLKQAKLSAGEIEYRRRGNLPVILMEIDTADYTVKKTYIYANGQILAQHDGSHTTARYFYLHDRLAA